MINYYISNRSAFLINPENNNSATIPANDPAYPLIKHLVLNNRIADLKFFTDIGYRFKLDNIIIESTRTHGFNIHTGNNSYSTFPSMYEWVITKIASYEIDKIISVDDIIEKIKSAVINMKIFEWLDNKVRLTENGLYVKGKHNEYFINFETNGVYRGKDFVCIHILSDYKDPLLNEKETCILTKTVVCLNDDIYFPQNTILKKFITGGNIT